MTVLVHVVRPRKACARVATVLAALTFVAGAAEEGRKVVFGMLIVGAVFVAVIILGDTLEYLRHRRERERASRPL